MTTVSLADEIINEHTENVLAILQYGVDVNQIDEYGFTPLIEAAIADNVEIAKLLIDFGANVHQQDMLGSTALHWAAENNNLALCQLLLENGANPNAYTFSGQPVMAMPLLRRQQPLKSLLQKYGADLSFTQDFVNTKLLGHIFELVGTADLISPQNDYVELDFEGFFLEFSIGIIGDSLKQFQNHFAARKLRRFDELMHVLNGVIDRAAILIKYLQYRTRLDKHQKEITALIQQEPLLIPIGYEGHAITFVKFGNILAKCDRREDSRLYDNIVFYKVNRTDRLTTQFIQDFIYEKKSDEFVNVELPKFLDLEPITELKVEAQISGNCSWANVEVIIPTVFFLLLYASTGDHDNIGHFKSMALNYFHQWREWNKDRSLHFCIDSFRDSDSIRNVCKAEILAAILYQRCRYENVADRERIESILAILTQPQYEHVLKNYIKVYCYESLSAEGKAFSQMLRLYGYLS